jgi:hypothetical protein
MYRSPSLQIFASCFRNAECFISQFAQRSAGKSFNSVSVKHSHVRRYGLLFLVGLLTLQSVLWGIVVHAGRPRVGISMSLDFSSLPNPSAALWLWGRLSLLTEMSTLPGGGGKGQPARKAVNFTATCEPIF